jgi:copper transport protein
VGRRGMTVAVAIGLLIGVWLLGAAPAMAHAVVVGSNPQAATRIARAPAELRVSFSEAVRPLGQALSVQGPDGQVRLGPVRHPEGRADVLAATLPKLADGSYVVSWRIVSADDGHLQAGSFSFAVGAGTGPVASPAPPQLPSGWQVAGRWLETAGVLLLVGVVATALTVWRRPGAIGPDEPRYRRLGMVAAVIATVGLAWQVAAGAASSGGLGPGGVGAFLAASPTTARRIVVEAVLLAGAVALIWWGARRGRRPGLAALVLSGGAVVTMVLGAHAIGQANRWLFVPLEVVHLLAVGTWIGGLAVLALTARRVGIAAVRRFSVLALRVVLVVAVTGIWQGLAQVSSRAALADTDYGRILAVKVAAFLVVVALAAVARFRLLPRTSAISEAGAEATAGAATGGAATGTPGGLRRLLAVETSCGAVVVVVAALLANTVPAGEILDAAKAAEVRGGPQTKVLPAGPLRLHMSLEPGTVGRNLLQVQVTEPGGGPVGGLANIYLAIADAAGRVAPVTANATRVGPATYRAVTDALSLPGTWRIGAELPGASPDVTVPFAIAASPATTGTPPPDPPDAVVLGGRAGSALAGLTAMTAGDQLVIRVRGGLGIPPAVAPRPLRLLGPDRRPLHEITQPCGDGCTEAFLTTPTRGPLTVEAVLPSKGTARFTLPVPLPRGGSATARLHAADQALAASKSFRIHEILDGGFGTVYRTDYVVAAPNRARWHLDTGTGTADTVWIGQQRWSRENRDPWKLEATHNPICYPLRNWSDLESNVTDLGPATWHGTTVDVLAFIDTANGAYHRLWVDRVNRILHERMNAPGHFMDRDYTNYNGPVTITPPQ